MVRYRSSALILVALVVAACAQPSASPTSTASSTAMAVMPSASTSVEPTPSIDAPSDTPSPGPTAIAPSPAATPTPAPSPTAAPSPTPAPTATMTVRVYFLMKDVGGGDATLVPVLRRVPESKGVARAALTALLAGPSDTERGADPAVRTAIPVATELLGITIEDAVATVDLSAAFDAGSADLEQARLAQVVYTVTQFASVDRVIVEVEGSRVTSTVTRATYQDDLLPAIFVDRPAWGATLANPGHVSGSANVFEAQFRMALLGSTGRTLVDSPVKASCGTGCRGSFDLTLTYDVSKSQWGTLRVWDPSEKDGSPQYVREYPVYLRATP